LIGASREADAGYLRGTFNLRYRLLIMVYLAFAAAVSARLMEKIVKYLPYLGLLLAFAVTATYALKAEWIKDYLLNWTEKAYGDRSLAFRMQKWFVDNPFYVNGVRIVTGIVAVCFLAIFIYLIFSVLHWSQQ
jgi:hypothetical protein